MRRRDTATRIGAALIISMVIVQVVFDQIHFRRVGRKFDRLDLRFDRLDRTFDRLASAACRALAS